VLVSSQEVINVVKRQFLCVLSTLLGISSII